MGLVEPRCQTLMPEASAVRRMFEGVAPRYDLLNHLLSLGIDRSWRRAVVDALELERDQRVLDLCCGTGDLALEMARKARPIACDFTWNMLTRARDKSRARGLPVRVAAADALSLPFPDGVFDAAPLHQMGAEILSRNGRGTAPLTIQGGALRAIHYAVPVASAQVKSAVLLAGLQAEGKTVVEEQQQSRDHTEIMIRAFGGKIETECKAISITGPQRLTATEVHVPGDISSAAFYLVGAAAITGSDLLIRGVGCNPKRSGVIDVLKRMGASVESVRQWEECGEPVADLRVRGGRLKGVEIGPEMAARTIDEYPVLSVAAALAEGVTTIAGAKELRHKESDRISVMTKALKKLGVQVEEREDGMKIEGRQRLRGARLETHGDHRIAMALAIAALCSEGGVEIDDSACVDISFPGFFELLGRICTP